jgi:hypothetical protein
MGCLHQWTWILVTLTLSYGSEKSAADPIEPLFAVQPPRAVEPGASRGGCGREAVAVTGGCGSGVDDHAPGRPISRTAGTALDC